MPLTDIFFRSQSKEIGSNEKLIAFLAHEGKLFSWIQGNESIKLESEVQSENITILNSNEFVY